MGLDWFFLDMLLMALISVPFERLCLSIQNREHSGTSGLWMWFISCPHISLYKFYLSWFYCPPSKPLSIWVFLPFKGLSLESPGFANFSWHPWFAPFPIIFSA